jgi:hypothetical protein
MFNYQAPRVESNSCPERSGAAILMIAENRESGSRQLHTDLMFAPRRGTNF